MFRFTIRDVLWLMVVVGLLIAWVGESQYLGHRAGVLKFQVEFLKGHIESTGHKVHFGDSESKSWVAVGP
jgi:hypothetical protein